MAKKRLMKKMEKNMEERRILAEGAGTAEISAEPKLEVELYLQYQDQETKLVELQDRILHWWEENSSEFDQLEKIRIYMKPEDHRAYFVINDKYQGEVEL